MNLKHRTTSLFFAFLLAFLSSTVLNAQSDSTYQFKPEISDGEKWVVDYQSDFSSRFQVEAQGKVVDKQRFGRIDNRKYAKTFKKVKNNRPIEVEHFYVRADRKKQPGNKRNELEEKGAKVTFNWNPKKNTYELTSTSHELSKKTRNRLEVRELYRYFLPDKPVNLGSDPWKPDVKNPVSLMFNSRKAKDKTPVIPKFEKVRCELADVRNRENRKIAEISILLNSSESRSRSGDEVFARLEGTVIYDLTRQKPVEFSITSRPAGIYFKKKIEDTTVTIENLGIFISVKYDTSSQANNLNLDAEPAGSSSDQIQGNGEPPQDQAEDKDSSSPDSSNKDTSSRSNGSSSDTRTDDPSNKNNE